MTSLDTRALHLARRWFGRAAADRVFEPLIADWQHDAASAPNDMARAIAHLRGALAFLASGALVVARSGVPAAGPVRRATVQVTQGLLVIAVLQGCYGAFNGASATAAWAIASSSALSVLPAFTVGASRRQRRFARAWRPLFGVTVFTLLAQMAVLTLTWPGIVSVRETPVSSHWGWQLHLLIASVLPGALGVAMACVCSRRAAAAERLGLSGAFPMIAWSDLYGDRPPLMSAIVAVVITAWAWKVILDDRARRARHRARIARYRRLASRPAGR